MNSTDSEGIGRGLCGTLSRNFPGGNEVIRVKFHSQDNLFSDRDLDECQERYRCVNPLYGRRAIRNVDLGEVIRIRLEVNMPPAVHIKRSASANNSL
jgi:hypothetical protein